MYLDNNRYKVLSASIMHEIDLMYISILYIYISLFQLLSLFLSSGKLRYLKYKKSLLKEGHWYKKTKWPFQLSMKF